MYILQSDVLYVNQLFKNTQTWKIRYLVDIFNFFFILMAVHTDSVLLLW